MLKTVLNFFTGHKETDWSQEDKEASLELLVLIMYVDDILSDEEDLMLKRQIAQFDWKGVHNEDYFLNEVIRKVRDLNKNPKAIQSYIDKTAAKISSPEVKKKIFLLCSHLSEADGEVDLQEVAVVEQVRKALS